MANTTVYPYGQSGSLPSGYPIADDLETDSAQQALSARQGKIIGDKLFDTWEEIDLSGLTVQAGSLGSDSKWFMNGKHIAYPVTPGDRIRIKATAKNSYTGGWYGFLNSTYTPPQAATIVPYVTGYSRTWLNTGTSVILTIPNNAAYLCMCPKDGGGESTWQAWDLLAESTILDRDDVVDNLYDGGVDSPLSAEQGKKLANMVSGTIPSRLTKYTRTGGPIIFSEVEHHVAKSEISSVTSQYFQGGACYGNYLFMFTENNTTCWVYNLSTETLVQTITIPSEDRGFVATCHCNTVNFGTEFYDSGDDFPLLYVSTGYNDGTNTGVIVYRIVVETVDDTTTYSLSLVQTVKIPTTTWSEFIVGEDGNCFIKHATTFYRMRMPKLSDGNVTLDFSNALEVYNFTEQPFNSANQNHLYHNGKIFVLSGGTNAGLLIVLDLCTRTRESVIDLNAIGITKEPESGFIWNGTFCIVCRSTTSVYALYFD